jgi:hypothetical protein
MKLDTDILKTSSSKLVTDMRGNKLFPLALVLLVAIVAVPIALSKSASRKPVVRQAQATPPPTGVPALNVVSSSTASRLHGHGRDPFAQQSTGGSSTATTGTSSTTSSSANAASGSSNGSSATTSTPSTATPATSTPTTPPSITPSKKPTPAPAGLSSTESYSVELAITNASGGINTIGSLQRLSVLPSQRQPLLVELGVLKGGNRVLFAVQPGTVVGGPGLCTPGPDDCEILSLAAGQTESVGVKTPSGQSQAALFAISRIVAQNYSHAGAAKRARRSESAAGRAILSRSPLSALSLFRYDPSVGAVLDLRSLIVGVS